jgi:hypothetical protein
MESYFGLIDGEATCREPLLINISTSQDLTDLFVFGNVEISGANQRQLFADQLVAGANYGLG